MSFYYTPTHLCVRGGQTGAVGWGGGWRMLPAGSMRASQVTFSSFYEHWHQLSFGEQDSKSLSIEKQKSLKKKKK